MANPVEKILASIEEVEAEMRQMELNIAAARLDESTPLPTDYPRNHRIRHIETAREKTLEILKLRKDGLAQVSQELLGQLKIYRYCKYRLAVICRYIANPNNRYLFDINDKEYEKSTTNFTLSFRHELKSELHYFISVSVPSDQVYLDDAGRFQSSVFAELMIRRNYDDRYYRRSDFGLPDRDDPGNAPSEIYQQETIDIYNIAELDVVLKKLQLSDEWYEFGLD